MRPFLVVSTRPEAPAIGPEVEAVRRATGLDGDELVTLRLVTRPLGDDFRIEDWSGVVVGGSPFDVSTPRERKSETQRRVEADLARLAEAALALDHPLFFTCYGIGVLTEVLGGTVDTRHGEPVGAVELTLTEAGTTDPISGALPLRFHALVGHKEATGRLPADAVLLASGESCPVQLYRVGRNVYASQFHPEATPAGLAARALVYRDYGYFPSAEYHTVAKRLEAVRTPHPPRLLEGFVRTHAS